MKFKPLHDRVLIEVLDSSEKTAGGIIIQIQLKKNLKKEKWLLLVVVLKQKMEN
jgi:co-chaperonin GroES (HSP10)